MEIPRPTSSSRRSTLSNPTKPDASLAEWTSKIKAMQKQVDEDEDAETRRLEAEITASRQARMRRSTNIGSRSNSLDLSQSGLASVIKTEDQFVVSDEPLMEVEKQRNQDDALRKLMGENVSPRPNRSPAPPSAPAQAKRSASPISLAAFMGGRATGPRLTKQAPQQDAHDPTQFEQRTQISAPHPVFGRGGVAMPGMTGNGKASAVSRAIREKEAEPSSPSSALSSRDRRISTPSTPVSTVRSVVERAQERDREIASSPTGGSQAALRQRTISTPTGFASTKSNSPAAETFSPNLKADPVPRPLSRSPNPTPIIRPITPRTSTSNGSMSPAPRSSSATPHTPPPPSPTRSSKQGVPLPGLARPIQPSPRPSFGSPQMPPSHNPSAAFLKPPPTKEPTPSLSRLQGRGFVKKVVERSATLEVTSPEGSPAPEHTLSSPGRKQGSVLDRWQQNVGGSPVPPPVISPKPIPMRKSFTTDPGSVSPTTSSYSIPLKSDATRPVLRNKSSLPLLPTMRTGDSVGASSTVSESAYNGPKLGSAKTMITFIQPTKTGDQPVTPPSVKQQQRAEVDDFGVRMRERTISSGLVQERGAGGLPEGAAAGKPLSHPTKDRAKKPRKGKSAPASAGASKLAAIREGFPTRNETTPLPSLERERTAPLLTPPQTVVPVRSTSPTSLRPSPPASQARAASPVSKPAVAAKPAIPTKPSLDVGASPAVIGATPARTSPTTPLTPPLAARSPSITPPQSATQKAPPSPARHTRIPSTGNRATVMDVAQAFTEVFQQQPSSSPLPSTPPSPTIERKPSSHEREEEYTPPSVRNVVASWGPRSASANGAHGSPTNGVNGTHGASTTTIVAPPMERRKSSHEKYSAFVLPPLAEERTPVPSPAGTLKGDAAPPPDAFEEEAQAPKNEPPIKTAPVIAPSVETAPIVTKTQSRDELIHLVHDDKPLPRLDVDALYRAPRPTFSPDPDVVTISVEVMSVSGGAATSIAAADAHVFYDSELLAVVHRAKGRTSGLVATTVWAWRGRHAQPGEREAQKVQELARRYGTTPVAVEQAREPPELVGALGGTLATRQGTRAHWSRENTAMHVVRLSRGLIYIDELDFGVKNLCSGYSYCVSILDTFYVWHGRGSTSAEQRAALAYARALAPSAESIVELTEDESQADEMFWMILGVGDHAKADHWKWRAEAPFVDPRVWTVDATQTDAVRPINALPIYAEFSRQVYLVDCIWELFVLVGGEARGRRLEIRLALALAEGLAQKASSTRPFTPPVHVLVFPTQIPTDLLLTFRELDEFELNAGDTPDHMNLITAEEADAQLELTSWTPAALQDHTMLPLGVTPSRLS